MNASSTPAGERRRLAREARDAFPPMGIYAVRDAASGIVRLASSRNVHAAINRVQFELRLGCHKDRAFQSEWAHDPARFSFEVVELVKERSDPDFDYAAELELLEQLHRAELCGGRAS